VMVEINNHCAVAQRTRKPTGVATSKTSSIVHTMHTAQRNVRASGRNLRGIRRQASGRDDPETRRARKRCLAVVVRHEAPHL
jgi:hypothetical protein